MAMNSVNTNMGAMVALASLNRTNNEMATTQKAISTGFRVADATDDGAAYAVAQRVRSDVGALTSVNQELNGTKGLVNTTVKGLDKVSNMMISMKEDLVKLASDSVQGDARTNYIKSYNEKLQNVKDFLADSDYNGKTLIGDFGTATQAVKDAAGFGDVAVIRNEKGDAYNIASFETSTLVTSITFTNAQLADTTVAAGALAKTGAFNAAIETVGTQMNTLGTASKYMDSQITFNNDKIDSIKGGIGALIDADLSKEAANLQALQIRQQLGTQALSMANQAPQSLLSLFR